MGDIDDGDVSVSLPTLLATTAVVTISILLCCTAVFVPVIRPEP